MQLYEFLEKVEVQGYYEVVYFDEENEERIEIDKETAYNAEVYFIYSENDTLYIEVEQP